MMHICDQGYHNLVVAYLYQMFWDYRKAVAKKDIPELIDIEKTIMSENFFGEICGVTSGNMLRHIRNYGYDTDKYQIQRDRKSKLPVSIIEIKENNNGESRRSTFDRIETEGLQYLLNLTSEQP